VTSTKSGAAAAVRIGAGLALRNRAELLQRLRPCFARTEPWLQAGKYTAAVMSEVAQRNGWSIARHAGDRTPDKTQRLLNHASWHTFAAMGVVRRFAVAGLEEAARRGRRRRGLVIGAIDETGQEKQGEAVVILSFAVDHGCDLGFRVVDDVLDVAAAALWGSDCGLDRYRMVLSGGSGGGLRAWALAWRCSPRRWVICLCSRAISARSWAH